MPRSRLSLFPRLIGAANPGPDFHGGRKKNFPLSLFSLPAQASERSQDPFALMSPQRYSAGTVAGVFQQLIAAHSYMPEYMGFHCLSRIFLMR